MTNALAVLRRLTLLCLAAWLAASAAAWAWQERLVFRPAAALRQDPGRFELPFETVRPRTADGLALHGWYLPAPAAASGRHVLFLHGNGGNVSHRLYTLRTLHRLGHAVLIIDYRGYGLSPGEPSEAGTYLDAAAAWQHLVAERGVAPHDIVIYGRSLGGAIAAALATQVSARGLVLESTFTRLADLAAHRYPLLPGRLLLRMDYDTRARAPDIACPVLVAHSRADASVPYALGRRLADALPHLAAFVELEGGHNAAFRASGPAYHARLDTFIREAR